MFLWPLRYFQFSLSESERGVFSKSFVEKFGIFFVWTFSLASFMKIRKDFPFIEHVNIGFENLEEVGVNKDPCFRVNGSLDLACANKTNIPCPVQYTLHNIITVSCSNKARPRWIRKEFD